MRYLWLIPVVISLSVVTACNSEKAQTGAATGDKTADAHPGKALHDANCISCHDSQKYTRVDRTVKDFAQLQGRVQMCDANLGKPLSAADIEQVTDYLNQAFYHFKKP